jgi:hypothetical protein
MSRQVVAREAAKDVRDLDHDGSAASEAGHQRVEDAFERDAGGFGEMGVDGGGCDVDVAKQDLHDPGVDAAFEQPSFQTLIADLATLTKNTVEIATAPGIPFTITARPTPIQKKALELLDNARTQ